MATSPQILAQLGLGLGVVLRDSRWRQIDAEARRYVDREDARAYPDGMRIEQREELYIKTRMALAWRAFQEEIAPLQKIRADLFVFALPVYEFSDTGGSLHMVSDGLTPDGRRALANVDALIRNVAEAWGFTLTVPIDQTLAQG